MQEPDQERPPPAELGHEERQHQPEHENVWHMLALAVPLYFLMEHMQWQAIDADEHDKEKLYDHQVVDLALENDERHSCRHHADPPRPDELFGDAAYADHFSEADTVPKPQHAIEVSNQD